MDNPIIKYLFHNQFVAALAILGVLWLTTQLHGILIIIFISYIIMAALSPFTDSLKRFRIPNTISAIIPYIITIAVLLLLIFPLVPFSISQINQLFTNFPRIANQVVQLLHIQINPSDLKSAFESDINSLGRNAISVTGKIFSGFFSTLSVFVISIYLMLQKDHLKKQFINMWQKEQRQYVLDVILQIETKIGAWIRGQLILSFTMGFFVWLGLTIFGMPFALSLGLLGGLLEIIPTIGPIIGGVLATIVALTISPTLAITVIIFYFLLQMFEGHVLIPKIMQRAVGLNPIIIILGILIGGKFLGVLGALLAVPFMSTVFIILKSLKTTS